jgi:protein SCO1/2
MFYTFTQKHHVCKIFLLALVLLVSANAWATQADEAIANSAGVDEHLGEKIDLTSKVQNQFGDHISVSEYFQDNKPAVFTLNYYSCASLCSVQLNAVLNGLKDMDWVPGAEFKMLTLSIDPEETSSLAAQKRGTYLEELGKENASWEFMVAKQSVITDIANQVGYRYTYDEQSKQFAHPAVIMILSPDGTISRYLYGVSYSARDLKFALIEASEGKIGTTVDKVILSCFSYDNSTGRYTASAFGLMRLAGVVTMFFLGAMVTALWRRERRHTQQVSE